MYLVEEKKLANEVAIDVIRAYNDGGVVTVADMKSLGDAGLAAMITAVAREKQERESTKPCTITVDISSKFSNNDKNGRRTVVVTGRVGDSLKVLFRDDPVLREYIECACGGIAACSTCHIYVDPSCGELFPAPEEAEVDMLDLAADPTENSRLGCQLVLTEACHDKLILTLPRKAFNLF